MIGKGKDVNSVEKCSLHPTCCRDTREFIPERNHLNVTCAESVLLGRTV